MCAAASTFQVSMIGHQNDSSKFRETDLQCYTVYPNYGAIGQLPWSKHVTDEKGAPPQVIFGAMNTSMTSCLMEGFGWSTIKNDFNFACKGLDDPI